MRAFIFIFVVLSGCSAQLPSPQGDNSFVLKNVNIVDVGNRTIIKDVAIVVNNGRIKNVLPKPIDTDEFDGVVIDGKNGYITPGLIDMHVHMFEPAAYIMSLSHGVTHVRIMNGVPGQLKWRDDIETGKMIGSTSTVSSPIISGYKDATLHHFVDSAEEAKKAVIEYHAQGYDLIKAYGGLNEVALKAIAQKAKALNFPVAKHGPHGSGNMKVSELTGFQSFEHAEDIYQGPLNFKFKPKRLPAIVDEIKTTQVPVTPTLNVFYQLVQISAEKQAFLSSIPLDYTPTIVRFEAQRNQVGRWLDASPALIAHNKRTMAFLKHVTGVFHSRGVELLVGSDSGALLSPHGIATHNEIRLMQESGLDVYDVLAAATVNAAKALGLDNEIGSIKTGYKADFILTDANPIDNISVLKTPTALSKHGYWYTQSQLASLRTEAIRNRSIWQEFLTLFEAM